MSCNNYEIIDLGVMVPAEQIVQKAIDEKVDAIDTKARAPRYEVAARA